MKRLYGALLLLSVIWGTSFLFIKLLLVDLGPAAVVFSRCIFGALTLSLIVFFRKEQIFKEKVPWLVLLLVGLLNNALPWLFIAESETVISSSLASILNATTPIWTLIIGYCFFSSRLRKNQWFGIGVGFLGIFILSDITFGDLVSSNTKGILFMSAAAICYGISSHMTKRYLSELSILQISFITLWMATLISFLMMIATTPQSIPALFSMSNVIPFIGIGSLGSGIAYLLYYYLVREGSPDFAALVTYLVPISAILWGTLLLEEQLHVKMIFGLMIILFGIYLSSRKEKGIEKKEEVFEVKTRNLV